MATELPEKVNAMYVITYDIGEIRNTLAELNGIPESEVKDYEIMGVVNNFVTEDFGGCVNAENVFLRDENGEEVDW